MEKDPELLYYMSNNHPEGHNKRRWLRPYCSCQLVLHLDRMRKANMSKVPALPRSPALCLFAGVCAASGACTPPHCTCQTSWGYRVVLFHRSGCMAAVCTVG